MPAAGGAGPASEMVCEEAETLSAQSLSYPCPLPALGVCWLWGFLKGWGQNTPTLPKGGSLHLTEAGVHGNWKTKRRLRGEGPAGEACGWCPCWAPKGLPRDRRKGGEGHGLFIHSAKLLRPWAGSRLEMGMPQTGPSPSQSGVYVCAGGWVGTVFLGLEIT